MGLKDLKRKSLSGRLSREAKKTEKAMIERYGERAVKEMKEKEASNVAVR